MKKNFYTVWAGVTPGIYTSWAECKPNVDGISESRCEGFQTLKEAKEAFSMGYEAYMQMKKQKQEQEQAKNNINPCSLQF
ncbi:MAG: RNase H1/viroplasmin domain-containing protein [Bacteroidales bacterium]|nr:RNase H1/viroplasmin domain-containing protein [Bacteroidales bacterium]